MALAKVLSIRLKPCVASTANFLWLAETSLRRMVVLHSSMQASMQLRSEWAPAQYAQRASLLASACPKLPRFRNVPKQLVRGAYLLSRTAGLNIRGISSKLSLLAPAA